MKCQKTAEETVQRILVEHLGGHFANLCKSEWDCAISDIQQASEEIVEVLNEYNS